MARAETGCQEGARRQEAHHSGQQEEDVVQAKEGPPARQDRKIGAQGRALRINTFLATFQTTAQARVALVHLFSWLALLAFFLACLAFFACVLSSDSWRFFAFLNSIFRCFSSAVVVVVDACCTLRFFGAFSRFVVCFVSSAAIGSVFSSNFRFFDAVFVAVFVESEVGSRLLALANCFLL